MNDLKPTFSFGENWSNYLAKVDEAAFSGAMQDIIMWFGEDGLSGKRILDLGCGSGIHSYCMHALKARELVSVDLDPKSVATTRVLWEKAGSPASWLVSQGSALDRGFLEKLGTFDLVYSWGVLHHTGSMWAAIDNAAARVAQDGRLWMTLYTKGGKYPADLALKQRYNQASPAGQRAMVRRQIRWLMYWRLRTRRNPFAWNERTSRGMDTYHDLIDWLGGLPYEVASADEVVVWGRKAGFVLERIDPQGEGACSGYVFSRAAAPAASVASLAKP